MIINEDKLKRIRDAVRQRFNSLVFKVAGPATLSDQELQELFKLGLVTEAEAGAAILHAYHAGRFIGPADPKERGRTLSLEGLKQLTANELYTISPVERQLAQSSISHLTQSVGSAMLALRDQTREAVEKSIHDANLTYRNKHLGEIVTQEITSGLETEAAISQIASDLRDKTGDLFRNWRRVAVTEVTNAMNIGEADGIVERSKGKPTNDIYVYKRVNGDAATCRFCRNLYIMPDGITPKVFRLSELKANGTNYGRKASEYRPTLGVVHPHCRCSLVQIPNGWSFEDKTGRMTFKHPSWLQHRDGQ